ncbi:MAG: DinB family protein [Acidobacteriaceae bacterium]|nr:DinB family protein [Acidobacteriaceae bacterium]MBV9781655.1 DinB family protein [Acidobacteriaceae bacterium]
MTRRLSVLFLTLAVPAAVLAQASAPAPAQATAATPANPISTSQSKIYTLLSGVVVAAAEKMPEENYSFKPAPDVRTFGQLVGHVADSQYYFCSSVAGEPKPAGDIEKTKTSKADLVAALKDSVAYCSKTYAGMTDAKGGEMMKLMNQDFAKLTVLSANTAHDYEHYGNMSTYMRIKGIVPPTSEKTGPPKK